MATNKTVNDMTRKELEALPHRKWSEEIVCRSIVILPLRRKHDSGFRCMDFVAVDDQNQAMGLLAGGSDVVHIDGIGGLKQIKHSAWNIDCLPKSGLLRLFPLGSRKIICGPAYSSFEVWLAD